MADLIGFSSHGALRHAPAIAVLSKMPPKKPPAKLVKKEESEDFFLAFTDIDWSQVPQTQLDSQLNTQPSTQTESQTESQTETQVESQTTLIGSTSLAKFAHLSVSPPIRTISTESGTSTQTNDSAKTLVVDPEDVDYEALFEGTDAIDWDDWDTDKETNGFSTPRKPKSPSKSKKFTPMKPGNLRGLVAAGGGGGSAITPPPYTKLCTRCIVLKITSNGELSHQVKVSGLLRLPHFIGLSGMSARIGRMILLPDTWLKCPILCGVRLLGLTPAHNPFPHDVGLSSQSLTRISRKW